MRTPEKFYRALHRIADARIDDVAGAFVRAIQSIQTNVKLSDLEEAVRSRDLRRIARLLGLDDRLPITANSTGPGVAGVVARTQVAAAQATASTMGALVRARLDLVRPETVAFARGEMTAVAPPQVGRARVRSAQLVRRVSNATKSGIREIISESVQGEFDVREAARRIRSIVGLRPDQRETLNRARAKLVAEGRFSQERIDRVAQRLLRQRGILIARTETIKASSAGQTQAWEDARQQGLIDPKFTRVFWIVTPDDRLCPICEMIPSLNPDGVPLGVPFESPVGPVFEPPDPHPSCRCSRALEFREVSERLAA